MDIATIEVERRTARGRNQVARLRAEGKVPAVLYGMGREPLALSVDAREFERHVRQHHKVFRLSMEGQEQAIFLQEVQWDPLDDHAVHIDFKRIELTAKMHVVVELTFIGHPAGASKGGSLVRDHQEVAVVCLPQAIPDLIEVNVAKLDLGDKIEARDLPLPDGVELDVSPDLVICHVGGAQTEAPPAAAEAAPATGES